MKFTNPTIAALFVAILPSAVCFSPASPSFQGSRRTTSPSQLHGISEWRDDAAVCSSNNNIIPIHLVDQTKVLLQGQDLYVQWTSHDDVKLFQQAIDMHHGVFALGMLEESRPLVQGRPLVLETMPLMEIQQYNLMGGQFGLFCHAKVVGRVAIDELLNTADDTAAVTDSDISKHLVKAIVTERRDGDVAKKDKRLANELALSIFRILYEMTVIEQRKAGNDSVEDSRWQRFQDAYQEALISDHQGYQDTTTTTDDDQESLYTWQQLNALSWAAFSTSDSLEEDFVFRTHALDMDCMVNRLKLANFWLTDILAEVKQQQSKQT